MTGGLRVPVAPLRRRGAAPRRIDEAVALDGLRVGTVAVDAHRVALALEVGASGRDVVAHGTVDLDWTGECRRCLGEVRGHLCLEVREVFRPSDEIGDGDDDAGDTYPLEADGGEETVDLEAVARDAVLLSLPLSPLCDEGCAGPDPDRFPALPVHDAETGEPARDPRWAALDVLREPDPGE